MMKPREPRNNYSVLIVEDEPTSRALLESMVENRYAQVYVATNGLEALELLKQKSVDLIISDVNMPKMNGVEMLKEIRRHDENTKVIFVTAYADSDYLMESITLDVEAYISKPVSYPKIIKALEKVETLLNQAESEKNQQEYIQELLDSQESVVFITDQTKVLQANKRCCLLFGADDFHSLDEKYKNAHTLLKTLGAFKNDESFAELTHSLLGGHRSKSQCCIEYNHASQNRFFQITCTKSLQKDNLYTYTLYDITEVAELTKQVHLENQKYKDIKTYLDSYKRFIDKSSIVCILDKNRNYSFANETFHTLTGYREEECIGKNPDFLAFSEDEKEKFDEIYKTLKHADSWNGALKLRNRYKQPFYVNLYAFVIHNDQNAIQEYVFIYQDVTELVENTKRFEKRAVTDLLTELPNRFQLNIDMLNEHANALALIDLDRFNEINDHYGYEFGDKVLIAFGKQLSDFFPEKHKVYKSYADQYAILGFEVEREEFLETIRKCCELFNKRAIRIEREELSLRVTASISFDTENLYVTADIARKEAKEKHQTLAVHSQELIEKRNSKQKLYWTLQLRKALQDDRIDIYYQPIYNNCTGEIDKYEALVRLIDEQGHVHSPYFFMEVAKKSKQYGELSRSILNKILLNAKRFKNKQISINVEFEDIRDPEYITILENYTKSLSTPHNVMLEIVESQWIENFDLACDFIDKVKQLGFTVAIDDFGTGYSNFEYLLKLNIDIIKIDGSLIKDIDKDANKKKIVQLIVSFAKDVNFQTVAEYVSTEEVYKEVKTLGIDFSQGYFISEPKNINELF